LGEVLVIDQDERVAKWIGETLSSQYGPMPLIHAVDGVAGIKLAIAGSCRISLAFIDLPLPDLHGLEVCRRIKGHYLTKGIPVAIMNGKTGIPDWKYESIVCGADAFLSKPIEMPEFTAITKLMTKISTLNAERDLEQSRLRELADARALDVERSKMAMLNLLEDLKSENDEKRTKEIELLRNNQYLQSILDTTHDGFFALDGQGRFREMNQSFSDLFGYDRRYLASLSFTAIDAHHSPTEVGELLGLVRSQGFLTFETELRKADGTTVHVELSLSWLGDERVRYIAFCRDLTERNKALAVMSDLREELSQAHKLDSIGRLAGGVAHDFNNMLGVILGQADFLLESMELDSPDSHRVSEIKSAALRSSSLTRQLLAFARKQKIAPKALDLNGTIEAMLKMLRRLIGENIALDWHPAGNLWTVMMDPGQVDQVLVNLCVNARDAIACVGSIRISTSNVEAGKFPCEDIPAGNYVMIAVEDSGCGMSEPTLRRVFEPFFTTKEMGKGTGLGLSTVYGIVRQNLGYITASSELGRGSVFRVFIPRHDGPADVQSATDARVADARHSGRIILVEDEPILLEMTSEMLSSVGYEVLGVQSPREAIHALTENIGKIDLIVTDVMLPEMSGPEMIKCIRDVTPDLPYLFVSGYTADEIIARGIDGNGDCFLEKPFSRKDLLDKVRAMIASGTPQEETPERRGSIRTG
jgi:PAS domain S-box-containing protein